MTNILIGHTTVPTTGQWLLSFRIIPIDIEFNVLTQPQGRNKKSNYENTVRITIDNEKKMSDTFLVLLI